ncbi:hypothetical protein AWV80_40760 [Cupriavidus sp. UYMU48A]|nr:hypothetical protein AWV80_40760 [Cupriavidus sp. UYMU48A]
MTPLRQLISLLHLASPALPIGGFSYSQGLETAIDSGCVRDANTAERWIRDNLLHVQSQCEAPLWLLLHRCWKSMDVDGVRAWNDWFHATRETSELRLETEQMGWSLAKLVGRWSGVTRYCASTWSRCRRSACLRPYRSCVALDIDARDAWWPTASTGRRTRWPPPSRPCRSDRWPASTCCDACTTCTGCSR